ncbi:MAG: pyruvate, phosphate dikinase [Proteobacteria bacterium]|nr:pyruvate, phosphate dikinase [Pseudomonadota bacterium]
MSTTQWIYHFGDGAAEGSSNLKNLLGGKGAGLAEMSKLNLPVPPGFTITTEVCSHYFKHDGSWPEGLKASIAQSLKRTEQMSEKYFGDAQNPLLVSVRSGAPVSMPGMMDTILNLGLNDVTVKALADKSSNPKFAYDAYRRFIKMFGDVVLSIPYGRFARIESSIRNGRSESELTAEDYQNMAEQFKALIENEKSYLPQDPMAQLELAINAVFRSFNNPRARYHRKRQGIPDDTGTAVTVQTMVFGNIDEHSATGVCFTRDPKTGEKSFFGEWLPCAQGEDVVAGTHTPLPLNGTSLNESNSIEQTLEHCLPQTYKELHVLQERLEQHYKDMQDIEFTVESGKLYLLQTRNGKRSPAAGIQIAVDLANEGVISKRDALLSVPAQSLELVLRPVIDPEAPKVEIAKGLDASPGAASGQVVFTSEEAQEKVEHGIPVILVRLETSPEDIQGMTVSEGILTAQGGQTSHAAVVARGMGKPCIVGCTDILVDYSRKLFYAGETVVHGGDWLTIDGTTGQIFEGKVPTLPPATESDAVSTFLNWADEHAVLQVRCNADNGPDAARAREMGAKGIGLCRTEHMFFQPEALKSMRQMLLARDDASRKRALQKILPIQREAFKEIFLSMEGLPVTIRLLDPPLHEFLPKRPEDIAVLAKELGLRDSALKERLTQLHEVNPMLGHRGCRIGVTSPDIYQTQVRAIFEAAAELSSKGVTVLPEVMIPLISTPKELEIIRAHVQEVAEDVLSRFGADLNYKVGTMIEIPRAALQAKSIAKHADFFSFGTNDLTQLCYGFSRDDMGKFLPAYLAEGVIDENPLTSFDLDGVGELVSIGTSRGRHANGRLKVGVCGEHGGDPVGIEFFHSIGIDYVSCSPFRVPVARLAAAQTAIKAQQN